MAYPTSNRPLPQLPNPRWYSVPQVSHFTQRFGTAKAPTPIVVTANSFPTLPRLALNCVPPHFGHASPAAVWFPALLIGRLSLAISGPPLILRRVAQTVPHRSGFPTT